MSLVKKKFRNIKKFPTWIYWIPAQIVKMLFKLFYRLEVVDPLNLCQTSRGNVGVTWHNRLMFFPLVFPEDMRKHTAAVVSASRDGQYVADFIRQFGITSVRGSSSKRGANAQLGAVHAIRSGLNVAFTPDGPRGPRYHLKPGPVHLASILETQVVPLVVNYSRYWQVKSWDGFQIPKPFSRVRLVLGTPIAIPKNLSSQELEEYRTKVENALLAITVDKKS